MGSEIDVLAGMPNVISAGPSMVVELSNTRFDYDKEELFSLLSKSPYRAFVDLRSTDRKEQPLNDIRQLSCRWRNLLLI
jgi:hypothetical protein